MKTEDNYTRRHASRQCAQAVKEFTKTSYGKTIRLAHVLQERAESRVVGYCVTAGTMKSVACRDGHDGAEQMNMNTKMEETWNLGRQNRATRESDT